MSYTAATTIACFFFLMIGATMATEYVVGDSTGWTTGVDYDIWASKYHFQEGDTLYFKWQDTQKYNVLIAKKNDFDRCKVAMKPTVMSLLTGHRMLLYKPGDFYFISDTPDDACQRGMKIHVRVAASPPKLPPPPPATPPSPTNPNRSDAASMGPLSLSTFGLVLFLIGFFFF